MYNRHMDKPPDDVNPRKRKLHPDRVRAADKEREFRNRAELLRQLDFAKQLNTDANNLSDEEFRSKYNVIDSRSSIAKSTEKEIHALQKRLKIGPSDDPIDSQE